MSSNISINRVCEYCGNDFTARTTVTKFCGNTCAKRAYKQRIKEEKIRASEQRVKKIKEKPMEDLKIKEFLLVRQAAQLLNSSRQTIYSLIKDGTIQAQNIRKKKTLIPRSEIDKLFHPAPAVPMITKKKPRPLKPADCYTIGEAEKITGMTSKALYDVILKNNIPKLQKGRYVYVPKKEINKLFNL